jgi:acyl carrier protein
MSILERLIPIFREVFADESLVVSRETDAGDVEAWDSFNHVSLITAIEETFSVPFTTREIGSFTCVGDVIDLLKQKGVEDV